MRKRNTKAAAFAAADIHGSADYPELHGRATFLQKAGGVLVTVQVYGLPFDDEACGSRIFALHIHSGSSCTGNPDDAFADAKGHFNPQDCEHPHHAGDLPPLFGNHGYAYMSVFTDRFTISEIANRVIIIHSTADDFTTQPAGNSGVKIACGKIIPG